MRDFSLPSKPHIKGFFFQNQSLCLIIDSIAFMPPISSNGPPKQNKKPKTEGLNSGVLVKHTREFTISPTNFNLCDYPIQNHLFLFFSFPFLHFSKLFVHPHRRQRKPLPLSKARPYSSNLHYTTLS